MASEIEFNQENVSIGSFKSDKFAVDKEDVILKSPGLKTNLGNKLTEKEVKLLDNMTMDNIEYQKRVVQRFVNE